MRGCTTRVIRGACRAPHQLGAIRPPVEIAITAPGKISARHLCCGEAGSTTEGRERRNQESEPEARQEDYQDETNVTQL